MPACILVVRGEYFNVDSFLESCKRWKPETVFHKGESRFKSSKQKAPFSGFTLSVSESEDFTIQIEDALKFINLYTSELQKINCQEAQATISFSKLFNEHTFPYALFSSALVMKAAEFGLGLEVGMYPETRIRQQPKA